jgi:endonuclease/exonuclease/phosphatase (EEP) superfamily protein YafD
MKHVSWAVAGGAAGYWAARLAGADRFRILEAPAAPLMSFTPHVAAGALAGSLLLQPSGAAATAAVTGAALTAMVLPRTIRRRQPQAGGQVLRVLTANLLAGWASAEAVVGLVRRKHADVLFLQELTETAAARLRQAGLTDLLPYQTTDVTGRRRPGSGIFARFPLSSGLCLSPVPVAQPTARLELPAGQHAELVCVHPHPPNGRPWRLRVTRWREELAVLPPPGDPPRVVAGDFNATADHAQFRRLLRMGHVDAAAQLGGGLIPTWGPGGRPALLTLDHVLVDPRCAVLAASVHRLPGSDHRAVYAEFRLPAPRTAPLPTARKE